MKCKINGIIDEKFCNYCFSSGKSSIKSHKLCKLQNIEFTNLVSKKADMNLKITHFKKCPFWDFNLSNGNYYCGFLKQDLFVKYTELEKNFPDQCPLLKYNIKISIKEESSN